MTVVYLQNIISMLQNKLFNYLRELNDLKKDFVFKHKFIFQTGKYPIVES